MKQDTYSINCNYYNKEFFSIKELIQDILISGQDPSYEITKNGVGTTEFADEYIVH
jgi:hypothetical protein